MENRSEDGRIERKKTPPRSLRQRGPPERFIPDERLRSDAPKSDKVIEKQFCKKEKPEIPGKPIGKRVRTENPQPSAKRSKKQAKQEKEKEPEQEPIEKEFVSDSSVSEEDSDSLQCFTLVDPSLRSLQNPRVKVIKKFIPEISRHCKEARLGGKIGSFECAQKFPGIPEKKFSQQDGERAERNKDKDWPIQAIYQDASDDPEKVLIYYEGWTSSYLYPSTRTEMRTSAPLLLDFLDVRQRFVESRRKDADIAYKALKEKQGAHDPKLNKEEDPEYRYLFVEPKGRTNPYLSYWYFEDLTYFHSIINSNLNLAPIFYMALCEPRTMGRSIMPPTYSYTAVNLVPRKVYDFFMLQAFNKSYDQLIQGRRLFYYGHKNVCRSKGCVCDRIFPLLYRKRDVFVQKLKYTADGRLDLTDFHPFQPRMLIECSDRCGCDANCPRRALQRGQRKPMVVNYQPGVGYALRTAENFYTGELICEYTGEMMFMKPTSTDDQLSRKTKKQQKQSCDQGIEREEESDTNSEDKVVWRSAVRKLQGMKVTSRELSSKTSQSSSDSLPGSSSYGSLPQDDMFEDDFDKNLFIENDNEEDNTGKRKIRRLMKPGKKRVSRPVVVTEYSEQHYIDSVGTDRSSPRNVADRMNDAKNTSYEAGFCVMTSNLSICALDIGNIARFINHGCSPNAIFVECHSRRSEKDPLIPRIGVFALRDIPLGEEVTVAYWSEEQLQSAILSKVPCKCGADNCIQFLPGSIQT